MNLRNHGTKGQPQQLDLSLEEQNEVVLRIERSNAKRLKLVGYTAIVLELLLILFHDLPNLTKPGYRFELTMAYLGTHLFLMIISIIVVLTERFLLSQSEQNNANFGKYAWVSGAFGMLFLSGVAFITGLDQLINNQIVSFIAMFAAGSMLYYCKPPKQVIVFGMPILFFVVSVLYFQKNSAIASANIINGLMFAVTMTVMSIFNYYKAKSEISKEVLLEIWTKKLDFLAHHDSLTGLYNRRRFDQEVLNLIITCDVQDCFALGIMDLDYFKRVNDDFGHDRADDVLINVAQVMKRGIEPDGVVARWGGEEFIFMLKGHTFESLVERAEALRVAIASETITIGNETIGVTGSFGLTEVKSHEFEHLKEKFSLVDAALYESKDAGRNRVTVKL